MKTETKKIKKADFREATKQAIGATFDEAQFDRAWGKACRWMRAAYGSADLENYANESGLDISVYYNEVAAPNKSFNRKAIVPVGRLA